ncbi:hypothetical protein HBE96_17450 [Clostridium sp. P21]|uniref:Uncharacterized protein n=1 Tax=Clostridium muellerianum TaxID=2716538 RepID=A0A7Y0EJ28_9CLOT|nr:hypothetical protein [Clostridium muellerianum]NMM64408.1 hypothetical protein [Clostridium muellerianum]
MYTLQGYQFTNKTFTLGLPNQVIDNFPIQSYVNVYKVDGNGTKVAANISLSSDRKTIIVNSPVGNYDTNSSYELDMLPGIKFVDNCELFSALIIQFNTVAGPSTTSTINKTSLINDNEKSLNINIDNPLKTTNMTLNSQPISKTQLSRH